MRQDSIYKEVTKLVADKIDAGLLVQVDWLTSEIISGKSNIDGDDTPFYVNCAEQHVRQIVKRCVGKYKPSENVDEQLVLDGFEHLQKAYPIERNNQRVLVPIDELTDTEIEGRVVEYKQMSKSCMAHAKELSLFLAARDSSHAA